MQTCLNERMIEDAVLFAADHKRKASYIGEHSSRAILPVEPQQRAFLRKVVGSQIPANGGDPLAQFLEGFARSPDCQTNRASGNCAPG